MRTHLKQAFYFTTNDDPQIKAEPIDISFFGSTNCLQQICPDEDVEVKLFSMRPSSEEIPDFTGCLIKKEGAARKRSYPKVIPPVDYASSFDNFELCLEWGIDKLTRSNHLEPEPVVNPDVVAVYRIPPEEVSVYIGKDTDAIYLVQVGNVIHNIYVDVFKKVTEVGRTRYYEVQLYGTASSYPPNSHPFDFGSTLAIWNARGMLRESFIDNFEKLLSAYNPNIVFITEALIEWRLLKEMAERFSDTYNYEQFGDPGAGGVVMFWDKYAVDCCMV